MLYKEKLEEVLKYYEGIQKRYIRQIQSSPPGSLIHQMNHGKDQLLHMYMKDNKRQRVVVTKNEEIKKALARKKFAEKALKPLSENVQRLRNAIDNISPFDPDQILASMTKAYAKLPEEYFFDQRQLAIDLHLDQEIKARIDRHREWGARPYRQSKYRLEEKKQRTSRGLYVRSKSEVLIIEMLYRWYDLPHRYEQEQQIRGILIDPDLTMEDANKKLFYWEHMGMMDNPSYANRNFCKLERYYGAGLIPGDNLILTFDRRGEINMPMIEAVILNEVIPRL